MTWTGVRTVRIWRLRRELGRCKYCHQGIVWVLTDDNRRLPFNPHEKPLYQETDARTRVEFDVFAKSASHLWTCKYKPKREPKPLREPKPKAGTLF